MNVRDATFAQALAVLARSEATGLAEVKSSCLEAGRLRAPDFLVIGAQKAGTTWLHRNLDLHPSLWLSPAKELNYFNEVYAPSQVRWEAEGRRTQAANALTYFSSLAKLSEVQKSKLAALEYISGNELTDEAYQQIFACAPPDTVCGESSPDYAVLPRAAISHITRMQPAIKIVLMLRDPIERLWSHVRMALKHGYGPKGSEISDPSHLAVFLGRSNYPAIIRKWQTYVGRENLLILNYHDVAHSPGHVLRAFCAHVGVVFDDRLFLDLNDRVGEGEEIAIDSDFYRFLLREMHPIYTELSSMIPEIASAWIEKHYKSAPPQIATIGRALIET